MEAQSLLKIVQDMPAWRGDVYRLATLVAEAQKEESAAVAENAGFTEAADLIRQGA